MLTIECLAELQRHPCLQSVLSCPVLAVATVVTYDALADCTPYVMSFEFETVSPAVVCVSYFVRVATVSGTNF
jgi:hypothetical protein